MSNEELLKPRYKVIAGWPGNKGKDGSFPIGSILYDWHNKHRFSVAEYSDYIFIGELDTLPHLFKKLEWYEDRELSEMPEYVKWGKESFRITPDNSITTTVFNVKEFVTVGDEMFMQWGETLQESINIAWLEPATKSEYNV